MLALTAPARAAGATVVISTNFPGGNVLVQQNEAGTVTVAPDPRGDTPWFYWYFEATAEQTGRVDFVFPSAVVGMQGPAVSHDDGLTWQWMGAGDERIWSGGGTDNNWTAAANWDGFAPVDNTNALIFAGTDRLANTNNLAADRRFSSLTFAQDAGPFVLNGNRIRAMATTMGFTNNSPNTQTLNLDLDQTTRASLWTTYTGDFVMNGAITSSAGAAAFNANAPSTLTKDGLRTLTLGGPGDFSAALPGLKILNGTVVLDLDAGGALTPTTSLEFGLGTSAGGDINKQGGTLVVRGKRTGTSTQTLGKLVIYDGTSIARIQVDPNGGSGTTLTLGNTWDNRIAGAAFLNIDLSKPGATLASAPGLSSSGLITGNLSTVSGWCTVTDPAKTGFATVSAGNVVRNQTLYDWIVSSGATNYRTSGTRTFAGSTPFGTLTIQGGGSVTVNSPLYGSAVLMEEGSSDYTIDCTAFGNGSSVNTTIHQHSTNGNLILNAPLNCILHKTGPGTLIIGQKNTTAALTLNVKEGSLDLRGTVSHALAKARVFNGGSLRGSGTFGIGNSTNIVTVFPGGTLVGTSAATNALTINGSLILKDQSNVSVDLTNSAFNPLRVTGTVTNLGANLALTLGYTPGGSDEITLLTSDSGIVGTFASINGTPIAANHRFSLTNGSEAYEFQLLSTSTNVSLRAVPATGTLIKVR